MSAPRPAVTIVVCTRNRADGLRSALGSLSRLDTSGFDPDVLVVDNGSTDATPAAVDAVAADSPVPVRRVFEATPGIAVARRRGVAESTGEWIAFFDDDQLAEPDWITELLAVADRRAAKLVGGRVVLDLPPGTDRPLSPFTRTLLGASVGMPGERRYDRKTTPGAGNLMVHRDVFDAVGNFDPDLGNRGEDTDLFLRADAADFEAWYTPTAVVHHVIPADRLHVDYLYRVCDVTGGGLAQNDRERFGRLLFPAAWAARAAQAGLVLLPRWVGAKLSGDPEAELARRCRLRVARAYLRAGQTP